MTRALLLNADWSPLHFISDSRAIVLVYKGRAEVINVSEDGQPSLWMTQQFTSAGPVLGAAPIEHDVPATIRLLNQVKKKWKAPRFRKKVLFNRDGWKCQYCARQLSWDSTTIDHVHPSSRGGPTTWLNCVTACHPCNKRKANKTPDEAGMKLMKAPTLPTSLHFWDAMKSNVTHPDWDIFLSNV